MRDETEQLWYRVFALGHPALQSQQRLHRRLPSPPRCKLCLVPFTGIGGFVMGMRGRRPSNRNPRYCSRCDHFIRAHPGGAEVELSMVFADVRQATALAERISASEYSRLMNKFYAAVTKELVDTDGFIIDVVGDEVVGVYPPGFSGPRHAVLAIEAADQLLGIDSREWPELGFGVGVHTGVVHIGTITGAEEGIADVRAMGDNVNVAARLASQAASGEALVSDAAWAAGGREADGLEHRNLQLKGRTVPIGVYVLRAEGERRASGASVETAEAREPSGRET